MSKKTNKISKEIFALDNGVMVQPFNLKKALRGDDVICRNGSGVGQLTNFDLGGNGSDSLYGVTDGDKDVTTWNCEGRFSGSFDDSGWDLFMVYKEKPKKDKKVKNKDNKKTKRWVNVYWASHDAGCDYENSQFFLTKEIALDNVPYYTKEDGSYVGTVKIKF